MCSWLIFASAAELSQEDQGTAEGPDRNMQGGLEVEESLDILSHPWCEGCGWVDVWQGFRDVSQSNTVELESKRKNREREFNTHLNAQAHSCTLPMNSLRSP